jgi:acetyl esterase/lipase
MMKFVMANLALFLFPICIFSVALAQNSNQPAPQTSSQPAPIPLRANGAPGAKGEAPEDIPSIQFYQPPADKASGAAIVVCPGGGYGRLAPHEGHDVAVWLNSIGVTAVVLKYRLGPKYQHPVMMQDALRAIRYTRSKASEWKIDPNRVGIMGFSAGGHLASTAATHFDAGDQNASDPIEKLSSRPDLAILCYPVITMTDPFVHKGSRKNLLGDTPTEQLIDLMSNEKQVTEQTPPTFLFHTQDDPGVPVENSMMFALALRQKKVPFEMHLYEHGRHGVGLAPGDLALSTWPKLLENWLRARGFVSQSQRVSEAEPFKYRNPEIVRPIDEKLISVFEAALQALR